MGSTPMLPPGSIIPAALLSPQRGCDRASPLQRCPLCAQAVPQPLCHMPALFQVIPGLCRWCRASGREGGAVRGELPRHTATRALP